MPERHAQKEPSRLCTSVLTAVLITTHPSRLPYSQPSKRGEAVKRLESEDRANITTVVLIVVERVA